MPEENHEDMFNMDEENHEDMLNETEATEPEAAELEAAKDLNVEEAKKADRTRTVEVHEDEERAAAERAERDKASEKLAKNVAAKAERDLKKEQNTPLVNKDGRRPSPRRHRQPEPESQPNYA